jgi:hypothetical protein
MGLWHTVFAGWISRFTLFRADLAPTCYATLKLRAHFVAGSLFQRISATTKDHHATDRDKNRYGPHLPILGMKFANANERCSGAYAPASASIMNPACSMPQSGMIVLKHRINEQTFETSASTTQTDLDRV